MTRPNFGCKRWNLGGTNQITGMRGILILGVSKCAECTYTWLRVHLVTVVEVKALESCCSLEQEPAVTSIKRRDVFVSLPTGV